MLFAVFVLLNKITQTPTLTNKKAEIYRMFLTLLVQSPDRGLATALYSVPSCSSGLLAFSRFADLEV
jgi:hypothetical protein